MNNRQYAAMLHRRKTEAARVKPHLVRVWSVDRHRREWRCSDHDCFAIGWGATPETAYEHWLVYFARCRRDRER